jgi:transposase-like protein
MKPYSEKFKATMVAKMCGRNPRSANELSREVGVHQVTLSKWLRAASGSVETMTKPNTSRPQPGTPKRPQDWTPEERYALVVEAGNLDENALGGLLRRVGIHSAQLEEWRRAAIEGLGGEKKKYRGKRSPEARRIRSLEAELRRKEKALAEAAALLILKKNMETLWEDVDALTEQGRER